MTTDPSATKSWHWDAAGAWYGGTVIDVAAATSPQGQTRILAATRAGLIRSDDAAHTWAGTWRGIADPSVVAVTFAGSARAEWPAAFAATETGRLYRSDDGGASWAEVTAWAGLGVAAVLCPSPAFANDGILFVGTAQGIYRTLDGGATWESCNFGLFDLGVLCMACAPDFAASQLLWAGTAGGGLYRSRNQARAWREAGIGLPDAPVQALAVSPAFATDRTIYAGLERHGIYRSTDGGETWSPCAEALAGQSVNALIALGEGQGFAAATDHGLFVSDATGEQWREAAGSHPSVLALARVDGLLAAGAYLDGVLVSRDLGKTWEQTQTPPVHVPPLVVTSGSRRVALDADGALAWCEEGGAWQPLPPPDVDATYALAAQPNDPHTPVLAATSAGLWSLDLQQGNWTALDTPGLPEGPILGIELAQQGSARLVYTPEGTLYVAADSADPWQEITGPWGDQTLLRALPIEDEAGRLHAIALTIEPNEKGHYSVHLWTYQPTYWSHLADLAVDIPSMLVSWPRVDQFWLAAQHRIVRLHRDPNTRAWQADQYMFTPGEQVTALYTASDQEGIWLATTQGVYHSLGPGAPWEPVADLPQHQPIIFLRAHGSGLEAVTLGGHAWRGQPAAA